jgi:hypothetical protein
VTTDLLFFTLRYGNHVMTIEFFSHGKNGQDYLADEVLAFAGRLARGPLTSLCCHEASAPLHVGKVEGFFECGAPRALCCRKALCSYTELV